MKVLIFLVNIKNQKGFSLVEIIVAMAILALFTAVSVPLFSSSFSNITWVGEKSEVTYDAQKRIVEGEGEVTTGTLTIRFANVPGGPEDLVIDEVEKISEDAAKIYMDKELRTPLTLFQKILLLLDEFTTFIIEENVFVYGTALNFAGNQMNGPGATIVIKGDLVTSDLNGGAFSNVTYIYFGGDVILSGGSAGLGSETSPGAIYVNGNLDLWTGRRKIYGDVYVNGNFRLKDAKIKGGGEEKAIYVNGDLELGWTPVIDSDVKIYYSGELTHPDWYDEGILAKCIKVSEVPGFDMPDQEIPPIKDDTWFNERGYEDSGLLTDGLKIFADSYTSNIYRPTAENVIIVAKDGDITITGLGGSGLTGVLYAPKGKVTFSGSFFQGLVIARDGFDVTSGGTTVTFRNIDSYISDPSDYPF